MRSWRPWAHERVEWKRRARLVLLSRRRHPIAVWRSFALRKAFKRLQKRRAREFRVRTVVRRHWVALVAETSRSMAIRRAKEALIEARFVRPRVRRTYASVFAAWNLVALELREERLAAELIQQCIRGYLERLHADAARMADIKHDRTARAHWDRRALRGQHLPFGNPLKRWHEWAHFRAYYIPLAEKMAWRSARLLPLRAWHVVAHQQAREYRGAVGFQRIIRGYLDRRRTAKYLANRDWAAMTIGRAFRAAIFRRNLTNVHQLRLRLLRLQDAARAIRETERMEREDAACRLANCMRRCAIKIQGCYRGVLGKRAFFRYLEQLVREEAERQRAAAAQRKRDAIEAARLRELERLHRIAMAIRVQNAWRSRQSRKFLRLLLEFAAKSKVATVMQAVYRGRIGRRIGFGKRRRRRIALELLAVRQLEGRMLRQVGVGRRRYPGPLRLGQSTARRWLRAMDLSPAAYTTTAKLSQDLIDDFLEARYAFLVRWELLVTEGPTAAFHLRVPKRVENRFYIAHGQACQVIQHGPLKGETGYVLSVDRSGTTQEVAEVRMDRDGKTLFIPVATEASAYRDAEQVLIQVPVREFSAMGKLSVNGIRNRWRNDVVAWASQNREAIRMGRKAAVIQCAFRQYKARLVTAKMRDITGIRNAVRCQQAARTLKRVGLFHKDGAWALKMWKWAVEGYYFHHLDGTRVPGHLEARPTRLLTLYDDVKRWYWRQLELADLNKLLKRDPEAFGGHSVAERLVARGMHEDDLPVNLKQEMPYRRAGFLKRAYWRLRYAQPGNLAQPFRGSRAALGLFGDGFSSQPLGLQAHGAAKASLFGRARQSWRKLWRKPGALGARHDLVTALHDGAQEPPKPFSSFFFGGGGRSGGGSGSGTDRSGQPQAKQELVLTPGGAVFRRAFNLRGAEAQHLKKLSMQARSEVRSTAVAAMELAQLKTLPFIDGDGWALVHAVYRRGAPDGWTVIHPLTGIKPEPRTKMSVFKTGNDRWTEDNSIAMQKLKETRLNKAIRGKHKDALK